MLLLLLLLMLLLIRPGVMYNVGNKGNCLMSLPSDMKTGDKVLSIKKHGKERNLIDRRDQAMLTTVEKTINHLLKW